MQFIGAHATTTVTMGLISIVVITLTCFAFGDFKRGKAAVEEAVEVSFQRNRTSEHPVRDRSDRPGRSSLVCASIWFPQLKMSVATAMLIGTFYALVVTRSNPEEVTKKFFAGMGNGYAKIPRYHHRRRCVCRRFTCRRRH